MHPYRKKSLDNKLQTEHVNTHTKKEKKYRKKTQHINQPKATNKQTKTQKYEQATPVTEPKRLQTLAQTKGRRT